MYLMTCACYYFLAVHSACACQRPKVQLKYAYAVSVLETNCKADLDPHCFPPLPTSRVFDGNGKLAFIDRHVTLVLQLIYGLHDIPA